MNRTALFIATAGGAGYAPIAPGTAGSLVGLALYWLATSWSTQALATVLIVIIVFGTWAGSVAAARFGRKDPGAVVIDEVAGQMLTLAGTGVGAAGMAVGFLVFRVYDVLKPWPADRLESLPGGVGIMADDLMAGLYANLTIQAGLWMIARLP
jgi:phosphatidylglycerophosphatase A